MSSDTYHRVDGVGRQLPSDDGRPFDPTVFEQAIHGLQRLAIDSTLLDRYGEEDDYTPEHSLSEDGDGNKIIEVEEDTLLYDICEMLPRGWDVSVVVDTVIDDSYAVRTSLDCGGGVLVYATFFVQEGWFRRVDVGHDNVVDADGEPMEVRDINTRTSSRILTHMNRRLSRDVMKAYAQDIDSVPTAFDYVATKEDIPPGGGRPPQTRERREGVNRREWAEALDKQPETVRSNVEEARQQFREYSDANPFETSEAAMEELDPDGDEDGDIRLV